MRKNPQNRLFRRAVALAGLALSLWVSAPAAAQVYSTTGTAYGGTYYYPGTVVVEPLLLPRTGSNDYLYTYDNVYGAGASAAGRMDRVVHNPPPQLYIPRQQPRVYLGY
ncbi:MAG TPA: hypothetical protein VJR29_07590 [bacterium]|nr:hypothetical protein [bacterium]